MTEIPINLGDQRLSVGLNLGDDFVTAVENGGSGSSLAEKVVAHLSKNPNTKIVGYKFKVGDTFAKFTTSLDEQLGLPEGSTISTIKDRLVGREKDFLLVVSGGGQLNPKEQKELEKVIKNLGLNTIKDE